MFKHCVLNNVKSTFNVLKYLPFTSHTANHGKIPEICDFFFKYWQKHIS